MQTYVINASTTKKKNKAQVATNKKKNKQKNNGNKTKKNQQLIDAQAEKNFLLDMVIESTDRASITIAIDELLNAETPIKKQKKTGPKHEEKTQPDISCFIADMKYDGENLKILEFGEITRSYFKGHDSLYGKGKIWKNLWQELSSYNLPTWYISRTNLSNLEKRIVSFDSYIALDGQIYQSLDILKKSTLFNKLIKKEFDPNEPAINKHNGILIFHHTNMTRPACNKFQHDYPGFIILNKAVEPFVGNKLKTSQLFDDNYLKQFKPLWKIYQKKYTPNLAQQIIHDFNCDTLVIKPLDSANGWGVIIVNKQDLDDTLKLILLSNKTDLKSLHDSSYSHWANDPNRAFLVESYEKSKPITVLDKQYDATMRMVFVLTNNNNQINLKFLGGYWKLPRLSLSEEGSLTEMHKSKIDPKRKITSAKISPEDTAAVEKILQDVLPKVYKKMLSRKK